MIKFYNDIRTYRKRVFKEIHEFLDEGLAKPKPQKRFIGKMLYKVVFIRMFFSALFFIGVGWFVKDAEILILISYILVALIGIFEFSFVMGFFSLSKKKQELFDLAEKKFKPFDNDKS